MRVNQASSAALFLMFLLLGQAMAANLNQIPSDNVVSPLDSSAIVMASNNTGGNNTGGNNTGGNNTGGNNTGGNNTGGNNTGGNNTGGNNTGGNNTGGNNTGGNNTGGNNTGGNNTGGNNTGGNNTGGNNTGGNNTGGNNTGGNNSGGNNTGNDTDGDGIYDVYDDCPNGYTNWTSSATTDWDSDGCQDSNEDLDDDNDGVIDLYDLCQPGNLGWISTNSTDYDSDGCQDSSTEDMDDDNDGVMDYYDNCQTGDLGWTSSNSTDADADGCQDATEDPDGGATGGSNTGCGYDANYSMLYAYALTNQTDFSGTILLSCDLVNTTMMLEYSLLDSNNATYDNGNTTWIGNGTNYTFYEYWNVSNMPDDDYAFYVILSYESNNVFYQIQTSYNTFTIYNQSSGGNNSGGNNSGGNNTGSIVTIDWIDTDASSGGGDANFSVEHSGNWTVYWGITNTNSAPTFPSWDYTNGWWNTSASGGVGTATGNGDLTWTFENMDQWAAFAPPSCNILMVALFDGNIPTSNSNSASGEPVSIDYQTFEFGNITASECNWHSSWADGNNTGSNNSGENNTGGNQTSDPIECGNTSTVTFTNTSTTFNMNDTITFSVIIQCGPGESEFILQGDVSQYYGSQSWNYSTIESFQYNSSSNNTPYEMTFVFTQANSPGDYVIQVYIGNASNLIGYNSLNFTIYGDDDNDGVNGQIDNCIGVYNPNQNDLDGDGLGDACDLDIDGDGIDNQVDVFPSDGNESIDTDDDGIGNNADTDDDGDGMVDSEDAFPLSPTEQTDFDGDGVGDNLDADDDGDGISDVSDNCPLVANADQADLDGDGIGTACDGIELTVSENGTIEESGNAIPSIGMVGTVVAISAGFFIAIRREDEE